MDAPSPRKEILVDEPGATDRGPGAAGWITPAVLFAGVLLTLLLWRGGLHFLFLPIILPFGLGGGRLFRRLLAPFRRRFLRFESGVVSLVRRGLWGDVIVGSIAAGSGLFVAVVPSRTWVGGVARVDVRIVGADGALVVSVDGSEAARRLREEVTTLLTETGVHHEDAGAPLQGAIERLPAEDETVLEWRSRGGPFSGARTTRLVLGSKGWSLRISSGGRTLASTGGPGRLTAELVETSDPDPFGTGISEQGWALTLRADGETVATIGTDLSEPELRFIGARLDAV